MGYNFSMSKENQKIAVNMLSSSEKVAGQGVSGAYRELINLLKRDAKGELEIHENKRIKADITHYHTVDFNFYLTTFNKKRVGRTIGYVHFLPETLEGSLRLPKPARMIFNKYLTSFYGHMDHLVVVNPSFIEDLVRFGIPREKITYIPNFVSKDKWHKLKKAERQKVRSEMGFSDNQTVVMGAGQVQQRKGIDDFVKLAKLNPGVKFIWAGGFSFGKITDGYEKYKKMMENPPKNLNFLGIIDREKMADLYGAVDLFLLPSFNELFPMTILEAASCGAPIMLRDLDLYKVILKGKYLPAQDLSEMDKKIKEIVKNPKILNDLAKKSSSIAKEYSESSLLSQWIDFYSKQSKA